MFVSASGGDVDDLDLLASPSAFVGMTGGGDRRSVGFAGSEVCGYSEGREVLRGDRRGEAVRENQMGYWVRGRMVRSARLKGRGGD